MEKVSLHHIKKHGHNLRATPDLRSTDCKDHTEDITSQNRDEEPRRQKHLVRKYRRTVIHVRTRKRAHNLLIKKQLTERGGQTIMFINYDLTGCHLSEYVKF